MKRIFTYLLVFQIILTVIAQAQPDVNIAAGNRYKKVSSTMDKLCAQVREQLPNSQMQSAFDKTQRTWVQYRNLNADLTAKLTSQGGSAYTYDYLSNLSVSTEQQIADLKAMLKVLRDDPR